MKKKIAIIGIIIAIVFICTLFIIRKSFALDNNVKDIKYYNDLIEDQKIATILLNEKTVSRNTTKKEIMEYDSKIKNVKDSNNKTLDDIDLIKTGDYITVNNEDYIVVLYGDVNKDGSICDIEDIMIVKNNYSDNIEVDSIERLAANLVSDDVLDTQDIARMIKIYLGILGENLTTKIPENYLDFETGGDKEPGKDDEDPGESDQKPGGDDEKPGEKPEPVENTPLARHGQLGVKGTDIVDKNGEKFQLKGVSTHGLQWFPQYVNQEAFTYMRDEWGINAIRLAMYSDPNVGYTKSLHEIVNNGVEYAKNAGIYVIIDWHILSDGNPNTNKSSAIEFFKEMTSKYKDYDNVIYEICNEPNGDVQWERDIKPYAQDVIKEIRSIDTDAIIVVGTPTWSQDVDIVAKSPIIGYDNIMYTLHFYAATHKEYLRQKAVTALTSSLPIFVTEFGICDAPGNGAVDIHEANTWINFLNQNNISWMCWNLSNKDESSSILKNTNKTTGWTKEELSEEGKWLLEALKR